MSGELEPILQAALRSGKSDVPLVLFVRRCENASGEKTHPRSGNLLLGG